VAVGLLDEHLHHCVSDAVASGAPDAADKVAEATRAIERLVRS
jgi:CsoR family transcriptional regulator, copper-sensing transcriptional repressor